MKVHNVHERRLSVPSPQAGALLDGLASSADRLWPGDRWPAIRLDRPIEVGAVGGHGPIGYVVDGYEPGRSVRFRFLYPRRFVGHHRFEVLPAAPSHTLLRHVVEMDARGPAALVWLLAIRPLHDALLEDALDNAERALGGVPAPRRWSWWVRLLRRGFRWLVRRRRGEPFTRRSPS